MAVKKVSVSWLLNFRIRKYLKSAVTCKNIYCKEITSVVLSSTTFNLISFHFNLITLFHLCFDLKTTLHRVFGKT